MDKPDYAHHFLELCVDKDDLLFSLDVGEVHVHFFHSSAPSENISGRGYESALHAHHLVYEITVSMTNTENP